MKRFLWALCALALFIGISSPASAKSLATRNIGWSAQFCNATSCYISPTTGTFAPIKQDKADLHVRADTTGSFEIPQGPLGISVPPVTASTVDTLQIGYVRFMSDSTTAVTNTLSSITFVVEGSNDGTTWSTALASQVRTPVSGDGSFLIPIWLKTTGTKAEGLVNPWFAYRQYRVRVTATTGNFFAARCDLLYWTDNQ